MVRVPSIPWCSHRILGRISEAWPRCRVTKVIPPPLDGNMSTPLQSYKQWLKDDMKWILKHEKARMKTSIKI